MKYIFILMLCLLGYFSVLRADTLDINAGIQKVVVFRQGAQVFRTANFQLPVGTTYLRFNGLTQYLDPASVQVQLPEGVTIFSVDIRPNFQLQSPPKKIVQALQDSIDAIDMQMEEVRVSMQVSEAEEKLILKNQDTGSQQQGVSAAALRELADFYKSRLQELKSRQLQIGRQIKDWELQRKRLLAKLNAVQETKGNYSTDVLVGVECKSRLTAQGQVSYLVNNAGWYALYDFRVKNISSPVDLYYKADVFQTSGEDWKDVQLVLSTGNPALSANRPELQPWRIDFGNVRSQVYYNPTAKTLTGRVLDAATGEPLIGAGILIEGTATGTATDIDGRFSLEAPPYGKNLLISYTGFESQTQPITGNVMDIRLSAGTQLLEEIVVVGYASTDALEGRAAGVQTRKAKVKPQPAATAVQNTTTVEFVIDRPYSIVSNGKKTTVPVTAYEVPAIYQYAVVPKLDKDPFLTARVTDWETLNLLDGEANLYFEGTFIGKSFLSVEQTADTLDISLGRDKRIVIERKREKTFNKRQFIGGKQTDFRAFTISIRNTKQQAVNIVIEDQVPVSVNAEIEVSYEAKPAAEFDKDSGRLRWTLEVPPASELKLELKYQVRYPKGRVLLLE